MDKVPRGIKIFIGYLVLFFLWLIIPFIPKSYLIPVHLYILGHAIVFVCVRHLYHHFKFRGFINILSGISLTLYYFNFIPRYCISPSLIDLTLITFSFFFLFFGIRGGYVLFGQNEYHKGIITLLF